MDRKPDGYGKGGWEDWTELRLTDLENRYEAEHVTDIDKAMLEKLRKQILHLLGNQNQKLLDAYTDRLIAVYNRDGDWFYKQGWQDALHMVEDTPAPQDD